MIGILGGMGPYATLEFYKVLLDLIGTTSGDTMYPSVYISSRTDIPSRTLNFLYNRQTSPIPYLYDEMVKLKTAGCDFVVCPCNSAHYYLRQLKDYPLPLLDIVEVTIKECIRSRAKNCLLLGAEIPMRSNLYKTDKIKIGKPQRSDQLYIRKLIDKLKSSDCTKKEKEINLNKILRIKEEYDVDRVIFACTELALLASPDMLIKNGIIDSTYVLAKAALGEENEYRNRLS